MAASVALPAPRHTRIKIGPNVISSDEQIVGFVEAVGVCALHAGIQVKLRYSRQRVRDP